MQSINLDGATLSITELAQLANTNNTHVDMSAAARQAVRHSRSAVDRWIDSERVIYGLTTGFGEFANVFIPREKTARLQENLIISHAAGTGELLSPAIVKAMMILRVNALAKGLSGIRESTLDLLLGMINANLIPDIPCKGSVGSSGDLAPLSHLALAMIGRGRIGGRSSVEVLSEHGLQPVELAAKEGLALINGTQMMTAFGALAIARLRNLADMADVAGALSLDALRGTDNAFDARLHAARPHPGQQLVAARLKSLLAGSAIRDSHRQNDSRVQDAYSLRCMPQVHGASRDAIDYVATVVEREMNSVTDNPLVFADDDVAIEGGNFHGQPLAITLDFLGIATAEFGSISERRTERMVNAALGGLPRFLTPNGGLNSGMMIAQYTAAALVSENKVLAHPASVDSIPTSANQEDHNSMGSIAARHLWDIVDNVERVIAIELLCGAQGVGLLRPLTTSAPLERVIAAIREEVPFAEEDRILYHDMDAVHRLLVSGALLRAAQGEQPMAGADRPWHALEAPEVASILATNVHDGLTDHQAEQRLARDGRNQLPQARTRSALLRFLDQLTAPLVVILLISAGITILLGGLTDALVILGVVALNAIIGFIQEGKAAKELSTLNATVITQATAIRDGAMVRLPSSALVVGDIVLLEAGDRVPADVRLIHGRDLQCNESSLTGESTSVEKHVAAVGETAVVADRASMLYAATSVTYGSGRGVVVATGTATEIGRIAQLMGSTDTLATPLTRMISRFSTWLLWGIVALALITFGIGLLRGVDVYTMVLASVALAVGAIPEGLPAAVTIILAIGVGRMAKHRTIIRALPAVETLGSTTVICSDKTGTLTQNQMTVTEVITAAAVYSVTGSGFDPTGEVLYDGRAVPSGSDTALEQTLLVGLLCGTASVQAQGASWVAVGDPTEAALVVLAAKAGMEQQHTEARYRQVDVIPFTSDARLMATLHTDGDHAFVAMKGSVESVLPRCNHIVTPDGTTNAIEADWLMKHVDRCTQRGMRMLALAIKHTTAAYQELSTEDLEGGFAFCGMVAMIDPPRADVREAINECRNAGIHVKMMTGDHIATARSIAQDLGMADANGRLPAFRGIDLDTLSNEEFAEAAMSGIVFARVSPEQKLRLVTALQARSQIVAMTGDGVNDAPALRRADVGVAMGLSGTDVAKDAADMVLTDDNFVSIVSAVREGRIVFGNLLKFIVWSLPTNIGEGLVVLVAVALGIDLPVSPVQLLWVNMTTAVILGLPLAFEAGRTDVMTMAPRSPHAPLLSPPLIARTFAVGTMLLIGAFSVFSIELQRSADIHIARTAAANCLVVMEAFYLFNCRQLTLRKESVATAHNPYLWGGIGITLALQLVFTYVPFMQGVFHTASVPLEGWMVAIGFGAALSVLVEAEKRIQRAMLRTAPKG